MTRLLAAGRALWDCPGFVQERGALVANHSPTATAPATWTEKLPGLAGPGWIFAYVAVAIICQLALLSSELAPARVVFRSAAFGTSLLLLVVVPGRSQVRHPARMLAVAVVAVLTLSALNPSGSTAISVIAHWCFYVAVLAPLFWVARLDVSETTLVRLLLVLWIFATASAALGVLQALFPGQFLPSMSPLIRPGQAMGFRLVTGEWVFRPMGLTDTPGGAATAGFYAALLGLGVTLARPFRYARIFGIFSMLMGMVCLNLCQVRAMIVTLATSVIAILGIFALSRRLSRLTLALTIGVVITLVGFEGAFALGGQTISDRLATLVESDPGTVYRRSRGHFVASAFSDLLPEYPLGAGLGRWGSVNLYFGSLDDALWSEVQWVGWIIDGGFLMLLVYPAAVIAMLYLLARIALNAKGSDFGLWAAIVFAYGAGTFVLTFGYPVFMSTVGIEFWLIGAATVQAARQLPSRLGSHPS